MRDPNLHLSDEELALAADGTGLATARIAEIRRHGATCPACEARLREMENAIHVFVREYQAGLEDSLPPATAPRALLKSHLAELAAQSDTPPLWMQWLSPWRAAVAGAVLVVCAFALLGGFAGRWSHRPAYVPSPRLTPGVARAVDRDELCSSELPKNQVVSVDVRRRVFEVYGISNADPRAYEVDYLITPALGGADDIRNLWPQPYVSTAWNAQVKDELEDRLRDMVCRGDLDLAEAQRDISSDWVAAYKKYFQTTAPPK